MQSRGAETEGIAEAISRVEDTRLCAAAAGNTINGKRGGE